MGATVRTKNLKPWKLGQSGNPKGKEKGTRNRSTIVRHWLEAAASDGSGLEIVDQLVLALIQKAQKGDVAAFRELMDSGFGKTTSDAEPQITYKIMDSIQIDGKDLLYNIGEKVDF